jgi:hypothetical protein
VALLSDEIPAIRATATMALDVFINELSFPVFIEESPVSREGVTQSSRSYHEFITGYRICRQAGLSVKADVIKQIRPV